MSFLERFLVPIPVPEHTSPLERSPEYLAAGEPIVSNADPATKGKAGGKLPAGNLASRSPARSFADASRKAATNHE
jgi:hypothetical protein